MKPFYVLLILMMPCFLSAQDKPRPAYCDEIPVMYDNTVASRPALPRFDTSPATEYKVQVAILKYTSPRDYPFHNKLVARYRPCEQVWVIESKKICKTREEAEELKAELRDLGYSGAYIIEVLGFE